MATDTQTVTAGDRGDASPPDGAPRVELDVRPVLAAGEEPFRLIMETVERLAEGEVLALRTPFDPRPLHGVMGRKGFLRRTEERAADDILTEYWRPGEAAPAAATSDDRAPALEAPGGPRAEVTLDVRGLTPPEPLERTLAALDRLGPDEVLVQLNDRVPAFLLPLLDERGHAYRIAEDERGVTTRIWPAESGS